MAYIDGVQSLRSDLPQKAHISITYEIDWHRKTMDLTEKHILITGGSRGIGRSLVDTMLAENARVTVWSRTSGIREQANSSVIYDICDVRNCDDVSTAIERAIGRLGPITGCIANAGVRGNGSKVVDQSSTLDECFDTNYLGTLYTLRAVSRSMIDSRCSCGRLAALGSIAGLQGASGHSAYAASKAAITALVKSLAAELAAFHITANVVVPGWIETSMNGDILDDRLRHQAIARLRIPLKRWGRPSDLCGIFSYLMSDLSGYHTGDVITIDGGYSLA
jgi:2-deoxy-D-gluconate 3-dehydrogenase